MITVRTVDTITRVVADEFGVSRALMMSHRRLKTLVHARQTAMWLTRELTPLSFPQIGRQFHGRDHTTIMHGCAKIDALMLENIWEAERITGLLDTLRGCGVMTKPPEPAEMPRPRAPSIDTIIGIVAPTFSISEAAMLSRRVDETTLLARNTAIWLTRRLTGHDLKAIGRRFDRTADSVRHSITRMEALLEGNSGVGQMVLGLMDCLTLPPVTA